VFQKHLTRLVAMIVTGSILVASFAEIALAGAYRGG
jgi:hypothetical protein